MNDIVQGLSLLQALACDASEYRSLVIPWAPASKSRPRFGRGGRAYTSAESRAAEARTAAFLRQNFPKPYTGNVAIACVFYRPGRQRIDVDNMLKHVCDAANGILWHDDSQATAVLGVVELDPDNPRTVLAIAPHRTTMTRGTDATYPCPICGTPILRAGQTNMRKTCSLACAARSKGHDLLTEPIPCAQCGSPFKRTTLAQTMCSPECRGKSLRDKRKAKARPFSRCCDCGVELTHHRGGRCRTCWKAHTSANRGTK